MHGSSVAVVHSSNGTSGERVQFQSDLSYSNKLGLSVHEAGGLGGSGDESDKENRGNSEASEIISTSNGCEGKLVPPTEGCKKCGERFEKVLRRIGPSVGLVMDNSHKNAGHMDVTPKQQHKKQLAPLQISISVVDPDNNNLNVCMCSGREDDTADDQVDKVVMLNENRICKRCKNIIDQQPLNHRKALFSQRSTLANDIIVNRIDSQFLNATQRGPGLKQGHYEPYTPDSMESHSPMMMMMLGDMKSASSSSSFTNSSSATDATTVTKSSSVSSNSGVEQKQKEQQAKSEQENINLIEEDNQEGDLVKEESSNVSGHKPELKKLPSVVETDEFKNNKNETLMTSPGVNARQLKSRLERLQILSRMPGHGGKSKSEFGGGRIEFEDQMRKREEKKELKEFKKTQGKRNKKKVLCCYRDEFGRKESEEEKKKVSKNQCAVM